MRICVVAHYCKPHIGGIQTVSFEQAKWLAQRGHQVTIVSSKISGEVCEENIEGVRIRRVKAFNLLEQRFGIPYPIFVPSLLEIIDEEIEATNICIVHSFAFLSSLAAAWLCLKKHVPYILYQHNTFIHYRSPFLNAIQRISDLVVGRFMLLHAAEVLAVSQQTRNYAKSLVDREVGVLYSAVDHLRFSSDGSQQSKRGALGLPRDKFIVLTVGRLVFKRSVDTFVAAANLLRSDPRIFFVVVGDGPERLRLEEYLRVHRLTNCALIGLVPHEVLPDYYRAANLFVLPSRTGEGLGIVLLEAMASELPVIATRAGGQVEIVKENYNGFLVEPCASDQIAQIVSSCLDRPGMLENMGKQGRETVAHYFTWDTHIDKLLDVIETASRKTVRS